MSYVKQRCKTDCGVACLAMLCDVTYEEAMRVIPWRKRGMLDGCSTRMLREGALKLHYLTDSTPAMRLKVVRDPRHWKNIPTRAMLQDWWYIIPYNSLVKIKHDHGTQSGWHWVVWKKGKVYDPSRGVFHPGKFGYKPMSYMQFVTIEVTQ